MNILMIYPRLIINQQKNEGDACNKSIKKKRALDRTPRGHELSMPAAGRSMSYFAQTASIGHGRPASSRSQGFPLPLQCSRLTAPACRPRQRPR
uniref:Uncharacterized protein n=1 Tax=Arundo donax TaxID=35708 RepID=A0A0A9BWS6_ARUDO